MTAPVPAATISGGFRPHGSVPPPADVPRDDIVMRPVDTRELEPTGDLNELRDEFVLLKKLEQDGYDTFGAEKLIEWLEDNWDIELVDW